METITKVPKALVVLKVPASWVVVRRAQAFGERLLIMQECMSLVEEVSVGVSESKIAFGDAQSIGKERGTGLGGGLVC